MFSRGYLTIGRFRGTPIELHWTIVLGLLWVSGLSFLPGAWVAYVMLILLHEMGHAFLARRYGLSVRQIAIHGLGGHCAYAGYPTLYQQAVIASGGVLVQALLLAIFAPLAWVLPRGSVQLSAFLSVMTTTNLFLILFNLIPIAPLDGHLIFQLPGLWRRAQRERRMAQIEAEETERARQQRIATARARASGEEPIDERAVKDLVRKALEDAKRAARERSKG